jgi:hypothetical protein
MLASPLVTRQLHLQLQPSNVFCLALTAIHLAALLALWLVQLPAGWRLAMGFAVLVCWYVALTRDGLLTTPDAVIAVALTAAGWQLETRAGGPQPAMLLPGVVLTGWLVVMRFKCPAGGHFAVTVLPDSLSKESFRHLRALLRLQPRLDQQSKPAP